MFCRHRALGWDLTADQQVPSLNHWPRSAQTPSVSNHRGVDRQGLRMLKTSSNVWVRYLPVGSTLWQYMYCGGSFGGYIYHLQYVLSDSQNLNILCTWDKAKMHSLMPVIFRPSDDTALKISIILWWRSLHGLRDTSRNHYEHSSIQKCKVKLQFIMQRSHIWTPDMPFFFVGWNVFNGCKVVLLDEFKVDILFGNHGCRILQTKEKRDCPACRHSL